MSTNRSTTYRTVREKVWDAFVTGRTHEARRMIDRLADRRR